MAQVHKAHAFEGPLGGATLLVAAGWLLATPAETAKAPPCPKPSELAADGGWTGWVDCSAETTSKPLRGAAALLFGETLDLNTAPAEVLEVLPRIGPGRARDIVAARRDRPFRSLADLRRVAGIGPVTTRGLIGWADASPAPAERTAKTPPIPSKSK